MLLRPPGRRAAPQFRAPPCDAPRPSDAGNAYGARRRARRQKRRPFICASHHPKRTRATRTTCVAAKGKTKKKDVQASACRPRRATRDTSPTRASRAAPSPGGSRRRGAGRAERGGGFCARRLSRRRPRPARTTGSEREHVRAVARATPRGPAAGAARARALPRPGGRGRTEERSPRLPPVPSPPPPSHPRPRGARRAQRRERGAGWRGAGETRAHARPLRTRRPAPPGDAGCAAASRRGAAAGKKTRVPRLCFEVRKWTKSEFRQVVSIYRPLGYGPSTLPLRHAEKNAKDVAQHIILCSRRDLKT